METEQCQWRGGGRALTCTAPPADGSDLCELHSEQTSLFQEIEKLAQQEEYYRVHPESAPWNQEEVAA